MEIGTSNPSIHPSVQSRHHFLMPILPAHHYTNTISFDSLIFLRSIMASSILTLILSWIILLGYGNSFPTGTGFQDTSSKSIHHSGDRMSYLKIQEVPGEAESVNCWKSTMVILEVPRSLSSLHCEMKFTLRMAYHFVLERTFQVVFVFFF